MLEINRGKRDEPPSHPENDDGEGAAISSLLCWERTDFVKIDPVDSAPFHRILIKERNER